MSPTATARRPARKAYLLADGTPVPSVTQILGNIGWKQYGLMHWAHKLGKEGKGLDETRDAAAEAGTICHALAAADIMGLDAPKFPGAPDAVLQKALDSFEGYKAWRASTAIELIASEIPLVSERLKFAGRLDAIVSIAGAPGLLDFKSSKDLYADHIVQIAAYSTLWNENRPDLPLTTWHLLRWSPDGGFTHHQIPATVIEWGWQAFEAAMTLHALKPNLRA